MITDEQLSALDQAERAATPGPWQVNGSGTVICDCSDWAGHSVIAPKEKSPDSDIGNCKFIALSRNHMRELLDEVKLARDLVEDAVDILTVEGRKQNSYNAKLRAALKSAAGFIESAMLEHACIGKVSEAYLDQYREEIKRIDDTLGDG